MNRESESQEIDSNDLWEITHAAKQLTAYGCSVSARHLKDLRTRLQFNREMVYYGKRVVEDVMQRRLTLEEGLGEIRKEQQSLVQQKLSVGSKLLGVVGGSAQVISGAAICRVKPLCATLGLPMMAHGENNIYENSRNLYEGRDDIQGPVRKAYQNAAKALGYTEREGNEAYLIGDLALSGMGMMRYVYKPDAWRLFRYLDTDRQRAIMQMSRKSLALEIGVNLETTRQLYIEHTK